MGADTIGAAGWMLCSLAAVLATIAARHWRRSQRRARLQGARRSYAEGLGAGHLDLGRDWVPGQPLCAECPYPPGTDDHFLWLQGYLDASHPVMPTQPATGYLPR